VKAPAKIIGGLEGKKKKKTPRVGLVFFFKKEKGGGEPAVFWRKGFFTIF